jgi:hypothetical protein
MRNSTSRSPTQRLRVAGPSLERCGDEPAAPIDEAARTAHGKRAWWIADARGPLASLADDRWADHSPAGLAATMRSLEPLLADIRTALEAEYK